MRLKLSSVTIKWHNRWYSLENNDQRFQVYPYKIYNLERYENATCNRLNSYLEKGLGIDLDHLFIAVLKENRFRNNKRRKAKENKKKRKKSLYIF